MARNTFLFKVIWRRTYGEGPLSEGGIAPNQVIARSELEVHCQIYTE